MDMDMASMRSGRRAWCAHTLSPRDGRRRSPYADLYTRPTLASALRHNEAISTVALGLPPFAYTLPENILPSSPSGRKASGKRTHSTASASTTGAPAAKARSKAPARQRASRGDDDSDEDEALQDAAAADDDDSDDEVFEQPRQGAAAAAARRAREHRQAARGSRPTEVVVIE